MSDWMDELERLGALRDKGLLSDEEFDIAKQRILSSESQLVDQHGVSEDPKNVRNDSIVRYDLSKLSPVVRKMIFESLDEAKINFEISGPDPSKDPMEISKQNEERVDQIITFWEEWGDEMITDAKRAEAAQQGDLNATICELCGNSPAAEIVLRRTVGMVLVMSNYQAQLVLCETCGESATKEFQKQTALKGWTSLYSAALNPFYIAGNAKNRRKHKRTLQELEQKNFRTGF
tara:strand:- start:161 stop:859 length:699 start_codon:yes stop_codon:yes gene_type:complete